MAKKTKRSRSTHRSSFEDKVVAALNEAGTVFKYEPIKLHYILPKKRYTPDIVLANGIVVELKGYFPAEDRTKMLMVISQNPQYDIRMVFQNAGKTITKASKTTYGMWADKNNIKWAEGGIPEEWINETPS